MTYSYNMCYVLSCTQAVCYALNILHPTSSLLVSPPELKTHARAVNLILSEARVHALRVSYFGFFFFGSVSRFMSRSRCLCFMHRRAEGVVF